MYCGWNYSAVLPVGAGKSFPRTRTGQAEVFSHGLCPRALPSPRGLGIVKIHSPGEILFHTGTNIAAPTGTSILAAASGTVTVANDTDPWSGGFGYHVKLDNGGGFETLYAHCSAICVTPGQQVQ